MSLATSSSENISIPRHFGVRKWQTNDFRMFGHIPKGAGLIENWPLCGSSQWTNQPDRQEDFRPSSKPRKRLCEVGRATSAIKMTFYRKSPLQSPYRRRVCRLRASPAPQPLAWQSLPRPALCRSRSWVKRRKSPGSPRRFQLCDFRQAGPCPP